MSNMAMQHRLSPGQKLSVRWRDAEGVVLQNIQKLKLSLDFGGNPNAAVYASYVDQLGVSVYIVRGSTFGGDIEAFLPVKDVMWQSYFEPGSQNNQAYVLSRHYSKRFPIDFL